MKRLFWDIKDGEVKQLTHPSQERLLVLAEKIDLRTLSLRQIGKLADINNPQSVKYHLNNHFVRAVLEGQE